MAKSILDTFIFHSKWHFCGVFGPPIYMFGYEKTLKYKIRRISDTRILFIAGKFTVNEMVCGAIDRMN